MPLLSFAFDLSFSRAQGQSGYCLESCTGERCQHPLLHAGQERAVQEACMTHMWGSQASILIDLVTVVQAEEIVGGRPQLYIKNTHVQMV